MSTKQTIDAHVHIVPAHLLGQTDPRFGVTIEPHGIKRFADGSVYQFMPDCLPEDCYPADSLIRSMDDLGIAQAVVMQSPCFSLNEEVIQAVQKYPDRLKGSMIVEPRGEQSLRDVENFHRRGLTVMKSRCQPAWDIPIPTCFRSCDSILP